MSSVKVLEHRISMTKITLATQELGHRFTFLAWGLYALSLNVYIMHVWVPRLPLTTTTMTVGFALRYAFVFALFLKKTSTEIKKEDKFNSLNNRKQTTM